MHTTDRPSRRRTRRWNVMWPAVVTHGDRQFPCTILDISELGARLESLSGPLPKAAMTLQCDRFGSLDGRLLWTRGKTAGLKFDMCPTEVAKMLKPMVPGLDRRDRVVRLAAAKPAAKPLFGRKPPAAPSPHT